MIEDDLKRTEEELSTMETWEATGYVSYGTRHNGGFIYIGSASPGIVAYHFARKDELRSLIIKLRKYSGIPGKISCVCPLRSVR